MNKEQKIQALRYLSLAAFDMIVMDEKGKNPKTDVIGYARQYCGGLFSRKQFAEILNQKVSDIIEL